MAYEVLTINLKLFSYPPPNTIRDLRSFLGMLNFMVSFRQMLQNYAYKLCYTQSVEDTIAR